MERLREKEEKEARKRQRLGDDFTDLLHSLKVIVASVLKQVFLCTVFGYPI